TSGHAVCDCAVAGQGPVGAGIDRDAREIDELRAEPSKGADTTACQLKRVVAAAAVDLTNEHCAGIDDEPIVAGTELDRGGAAADDRAGIGDCPHASVWVSKDVDAIKAADDDAARGIGHGTADEQGHAVA